MSYITIDAVDENNEVREVLVSASEPPQFGEFFDYDGELLRRLPQAPTVAVKRGFEGHRAYSLPRKKTAIKQGRTLAPKYDKRGIAVFENRAQMERFVGQHNDNPVNGGTLFYDPDGNE